MPCAAVPTAALGGRPGPLPAPGAAHRAAAGPGRGTGIACRAAAAAPAPPDRAAASERRLAAGEALPASSGATGSHPAPTTWPTHSWQLRSNPPGVTDAVLERLRRQLGWGGRWAWEWDQECEPATDETEAEEDADEACSSSSASRSEEQHTTVWSSRGAGRRSGARRRCRSRALAGAAVYDAARPWSGAATDTLPEELQDWRAGQLLTAEQEAWLGELLQAGRAAELQSGAAPAGASSSGSSSTLLWRRRVNGPAEQLDVAMQRGAAAQQLLFDANLRLVALARRKLLGGAYCLPAPLHQEVDNAGRDALWRAAAGFQPSRRTRFSSYAVPAIQNAMRDVLQHRQEAGVHVPAEARAWEARVASAARTLQQLERQGPSGRQLGARQRRPQQQQQQQPGRTRLERLAAAAQLAPQQVLLGLRAGQRQRLASFDCLVPVEVLEGAAGRRSNQPVQLARFGDVPHVEQQQRDEDDAASEAAREAVQQLLPRLRTSRHADVLRLRHRLDGGAGSAEQPELDFTTVGKRLGISRQRAQQLYHAAVAAARHEAAALGLL